MKLMDLIDVMNTCIRKHNNGKSLKVKNIKKLIDQLDLKHKKYETAFAAEQSKKGKSKLDIKRKVVKAKIKKAHKLLENISS